MVIIVLLFFLDEIIDRFYVEYIVNSQITLLGLVLLRALLPFVLVEWFVSVFSSAASPIDCH